MNGPTKNAEEGSLQGRQDWFQRLVEIGGVIVFLGLLIEDGPELWESILQQRLPSRAVIGGIIVALGVGVEVLFASLVTHTSKQLQAFADARNAEFHRLAANAELESAKANESAAEAHRIAEQEQLARIKIEERMGGWRLDAETQAELTRKLRLWPGTPFDLSTDPAELRFMDQLLNVLEGAGWVRRIPSGVRLANDKAALHFGGIGVTIQVAKESHRRFQIPAGALIGQLQTANIPAGIDLAQTGTVTADVIHIHVGRRE